MADDENRSKLFDEIRNFSQRKLKKVETKVTTGSGEQLTEKRSPKGLQQIKSNGINSVGYVVDTKPDLQVGMIIPGLLISSQDVAQDKSLLETYEITHILNLAPGVPNVFEDDYNYKKIEILDLPETDITQYFDECIEFIQEGIQRGNCLVHCNAGVSRSTTLCCAYLMKKNKMKYKEALAAVREARAFAKPNEGFAKQLEQYEDQLFGQMAAPDSSEDKFMARKRAEIEAEKAAISGTSSVKNKLKSFGAQLESVYAQKLQAITPIKLPLKKKTTTQPATQPIKNRKKSLSNSTLPGDIAPPPPPPPSLFEQNFNANAKKPQNIKKTINKVTTPIETNHQIVSEPPKRTSKSDLVDETPIKVAAQKKLWESANNNQQNNINVSQNAAKNTVTVQQPKSQQTQSQTTKNKLINKSKLGTWEKCPPAPNTETNNANAMKQATPLVAASPEPKKKIIIKKKDVNNNNVINNFEWAGRRTTRDLAAAIEAASESNSQSSTPYSSPGPQRRQMQYGRRTSTQSISNETQTVPRKPMWGLRDQVDSLADTTPTSTPTRCRSPAIASTRGESHSPSPQPGAAKKVFGRVPPRKTSLSDTGKIANNESNELPVVSAPTTSAKIPSTNVTTTNKLKNKEPELSNQNNNNKTTLVNNTKSTNNQESSSKNKLKTNETISKTPICSNYHTEERNDNVRSGFKKVPLSETKEKPMNRSIEARKKSKGLNRSSTAEILKLIKTKSRADFGKSMETVDEDVEIEYLLNQLDEAGLDNIDWNEIGIDEKEVKDIVEKNQDDEPVKISSSSEEESSSEESEDSESSSEEDSDDEMEHTVFKQIAPPTTTTLADKTKMVNNLVQPKITSTATLTLKPQQNSLTSTTAKSSITALEVESEEDSESETESD